MQKNINAVSDEIIGRINERTLYYFREICKIVPRGSKKETAVCAYLKAFADGMNKKGMKIVLKHQCEIRENKPINNIVLIKSAANGYETSKPVALQAHLDMVCQKTEGSKHDFDKDPVQVVVNGNEMSSKGKETTLGADDGIGVACILAILESDELKHPELQAVFTSDEEDGMSGAKWFNPNLITATRIVNLDAETEGILYYGCAGGIYANLRIPAAYRNIPKNAELYDIKISGLNGGHSGLKIGFGYANANRLMGRLLGHLQTEFETTGGIILPANINGGNAKNAITKEAAATVAVPHTEHERLARKIKELEATFRQEYGMIEQGLTVTAGKSAKSFKQVMTAETLTKIVAALTGVPDGVIEWYAGRNLVETSSNLGIVNSDLGGVTMTCFVRSFAERKKRLVANQIRELAESIDAECKEDHDFPAWNPNLNSPLLALFQKTYCDIFQKEPACESVHAGLECSYFYEKFFNSDSQSSVDLIAIGPTVEDAHLPSETLRLDTTKPFIKLLLNALEQMKDR